jgi:uncharacterized low-complexity protein
MNIVKKSIIAIVMSLLAFNLFTSNIAKAESNPFASAELVTIVSDHVDGKCGEGKMQAATKGKCGEGKIQAATKGKCGEGKMKAAKKGKCGEGKCGEGKMKAAKKGKCGEGKCGEGKSTEKSKKCGG